MKKYLLGYDIGSSSVKASLVSIETGKSVASAFYPDSEAPIKALNPGWAEQEPDDWWTYLKNVTAKVMQMSGAKGNEIEAIGISYQMHGLVCVDKNGKALRPAIIWCDSRAVPYGDKAFREIGKGQCLTNLLNSPGNFTAAKLAWVKENEPKIYEKIDKIILNKLPKENYKKFIVIDATTGQNGLSQVEIFNEALALDGIILSKYDSAAKGGILLSISGKLGIPVAFVGTGEKYGDFAPFNKKSYLEGLLATD